MYNKAKRFENCSFTTKDGKELPMHKPPTYDSTYKHIDPGTPVPDFAIIDFNIIPIRCCASFMLQNYVASHIGYEDSKNRDDLISIASNIYHQNKNILEPQLVPMQINAWSLQGVFLPVNDSTWTHEGYFIKLKQCVCAVTDELLLNIYRDLFLPSTHANSLTAPHVHLRY